MIDIKKFCPAPFVNVTTRTTGSIKPCCVYPTDYSNVKNSSIEQKWNSPDFVNLRQIMLDGSQTNLQCKQACYDKELQNQNSDRLGWLRRVDLLDSDVDTQLKKLQQWDKISSEFPSYVELQISNLCNLKCLTCFPGDSSSFLYETIQIVEKTSNKTNISDQSLIQSMYQYQDHELDKLFCDILNHDIKVLDLRGGETMLVPIIQQRLLNLDSDKKQKIQLRIQTNGTILNPTWKEILNSYQKIDLQVSIDAVGTDINYIRHPAEWNRIQKNLEFFRSLPNVNLTIACTVSNLNLPILTKFLNWADGENYVWGMNTVVNPRIFNPANLPQSVLHTAMEKIATFQPKHPENATMVNYLTKLAPLDDKQLWQQFCREISSRDAYRKNSIFDIHPELKNFWVL